MTALNSLATEDIVGLLDLAPHPEGGYYRESFRDPRLVDNARAASTAIYFLLPAGVVSAWHRVDAAELWHFYAGAPLFLSLHDAGAVTTRRLGVDLAAGERPQALVPAGVWQFAKSLGAWSLVGCTVAPGFEFAHFEIAPPGLLPDKG